MNQSRIFHVFVFLGMLFLLGNHAISGQESWTIINQTDLKKDTNTVGFLNDAFGITVGARGQIYYTFQGRLNYILFLPQGYEKTENSKWPLILFLNDMGDRGDTFEALENLKKIFFRIARD